MSYEHKELLQKHYRKTLLVVYDGTGAIFRTTPRCFSQNNVDVHSIQSEVKRNNRLSNVLLPGLDKVAEAQQAQVRRLSLQTSFDVSCTPDRDY
ncbi:hypothetical protein ANCCAN_07218 [Ancylostoma caninum]|uniref:Uncharacterized protein n=1 Tax=Ancylostoma caninum TaxID=29170 RepID=A0A368GQZ1_ANCCA|nr:hypothetical protein ANCCAN_07218 [Ancylostoma caninum]